MLLQKITEHLIHRERNQRQIIEFEVLPLGTEAPPELAEKIKEAKIRLDEISKLQALIKELHKPIDFEKASLN